MRVEARAGVRRWVLDRPARRNTLDPATIAALRGELAALADDESVRLVELAAEGTTWCAGADLTALSEPAPRTAALHAFADLLADLVDAPVPVLALVDGAVIGGGVGLLCAVDLVAMGPGASVALPEAGLGLWPMMVGALLGRVVPPRVAMELALTARPLDATECLRVGFATTLGASAEVAAATLVERVLRQGPVAVRAGRRAWRHHASLEAGDLRPRLHALADALDVLSIGPEAAEGVAAFLQKRRPAW